MNSWLIRLLFFSLSGWMACNPNSKHDPSVEKKVDKKVTPVSAVKVVTTARGDTSKSEKLKSETPPKDTGVTPEADAKTPPATPQDPPKETVRIEKGVEQARLSDALLSGWLPLDTALEIEVAADYQQEIYVVFRVPGMALFEQAVQKKMGQEALKKILALKLGPDDDRTYNIGDMMERLKPYENVPFTENFSNNQQTHDESWTYWFARLSKKAASNDTASAKSTDDTSVQPDVPTDVPTDVPNEPAGFLYKRIYNILLLDCSFPDTSPEVWTPTAATEIKVRDMDNDKKPEAKVVFTAILDRSPGYSNINAYRTMAFIVDRDGLIQAKFEREIYDDHQMQGQIGFDQRTTVWQFKDLNSDGYPDLAVKRRWSVNLHQWECGEDVEQPDDIKKQGSDERECLYEPKTDLWNCPAPPEINIYN